MTMLPGRKALLLGVITAMPTSIAFMPAVSRASFNMHADRREGVQQNVLPDVASHLPDTVAQYPVFLEAILSTLYTPAVQFDASDAVKLGIAHGHSQSMFGPPDMYLLQGKSILPAPGMLDALDVPNVEVPQKIAEFFDYAKAKGVSVIDPRSVIQVNEFLPGFAKTGHIFPELKSYPVSERGLKLELAQAIGYQKVFFQLPKAAFAAAIVDFFFVSPGLDAYKEEIEDDLDDAAAGAITELGIRTAALSIVAAITLAIFNN